MAQMNKETFDTVKFGDLIAANAEYIKSFKYSEPGISAARARTHGCAKWTNSAQQLEFRC